MTFSSTGPVISGKVIFPLRDSAFSLDIVNLINSDSSAYTTSRMNYCPSLAISVITSPIELLLSI